MNLTFFHSIRDFTPFYSSVTPALSFVLPHLLHALLKEGVPPGLADNKIGPLDNHNADKEAGVAGEFNDLPLLVGLPG